VEARLSLKDVAWQDMGTRISLEATPMPNSSVRDQIGWRFLNGSMTLNQMVELQELGSGAMPDGPDLKNKIKSVERLGSALRVTLLKAHSKSGGTSSDLLTPEGIDLIDIVGRFMEDLDRFSQLHSQHGPSIRLASSTTLLHWLVLPSIRLLQGHAAAFEGPRQPELTFHQVEIDTVASGLSSHRFQFAVIRESSELDVTLIEDGHGWSVEESLRKWADCSDEEFDRMQREQGSSWWGGASHGHRRIGFVLGQYDYHLCLRRAFYERIEGERQRAGRNLLEDVPVALCTNHRKFASELRQMEEQRGFRVTIRTDTWVESAQLALHGDFATILPTIALSVNPDLVPVGDRGLHAERVLLVCNPSILHSRFNRQMLCAIATALSGALRNQTIHSLA